MAVHVLFAGETKLAHSAWPPHISPGLDSADVFLLASALVNLPIKFCSILASALPIWFSSSLLSLVVSESLVAIPSGVDLERFCFLSRGFGDSAGVFSEAVEDRVGRFNMVVERQRRSSE
jgi:hypothetical protein